MGQLLVLQNSTAWAQQLDFIEYSARNFLRIRVTAVKEKKCKGQKILKI
jgi:hypothetical protein